MRFRYYSLCTNEASEAGFTENEALQYAGIKEIVLVQNDHSAFPAPIKIEDNDPLLLETMKRTGKKAQVVRSHKEGEYTRREFISSILVLAATISGVKLACEEQIDLPEKAGWIGWPTTPIIEFSSRKGRRTTSRKDYTRIWPTTARFFLCCDGTEQTCRSSMSAWQITASSPFSRQHGACSASLRALWLSLAAAPFPWCRSESTHASIHRRVATHQYKSRTTSRNGTSPGVVVVRALERKMDPFLSRRP